jgi:hypothetical protein
MLSKTKVDASTAIQDATLLFKGCLCNIKLDFKVQKHP